MSSKSGSAAKSPPAKSPAAKAPAASASSSASKQPIGPLMTSSTAAASSKPASGAKSTESKSKKPVVVESSSEEEDDDDEDEDADESDEEDQSSSSKPASTPGVAAALRLSTYNSKAPRVPAATAGLVSPAFVAEVRAKLGVFWQWLLVAILEAFNGPYGTIVIATFTVVAIFLDDIRLWAVPKSSEGPVFVVLLIIFIFFAIEWTFNSLLHRGYAYSFFWYLDFIATLSLIPDIPFFWTPMLVAFGVTGASSDAATSQANIARAHSVSALGTRAGRVLKLVRLIRVVRIAKLFDACLKNRQKRKSAVYQQDRERMEQELLEIKTSAALELQKSLGKLGAAAAAKDKGDKNVNAKVIKAREQQREREKQRELERLEEEQKDRLAKLEEEKQTQLKAKEAERKKAEDAKRIAEEEAKKLAANAGPVTTATWAEAQQVDQSNSRVGEHLSEKTTRRVVVIVLAMLFGLPAISISVSSTSQQDGLDYLTYLADHNATRAVFDDAFERYRFFPSVNQWELVSIHVQRAPQSLYNISLDAEYQPLENFRDLEIKFVLSTNAAGLYNVAAFNVRNNVRLEGAYSALTTLIVVVLLAIGTSLFGSDADEIVISPIQRMIDVIENMKKNPLAKMTTGDDAELLARMKRAKAGLGGGASTWGDWARDKAEAAWTLVSGGGGNQDEDAETGLLEKTLQKLSGLLQVGFGEAGASIIQRNLGSGELNVMVEGERMLAIFGFCDVRSFADITQCLQGDIFLFVNTVAEIVHAEVARCSGAANKNIGEAFLVAWRLPKDLLEEDLALVASAGADSVEIECLPAPRRAAIAQARVLADKALTAFLRVILRVASSQELCDFGKNAAMRAVFGDDFRVSMGFGLHVGWAIEGAIGSNYKIDASYLSPNVNMAARLEAATRQFQVPLLVSGSFHSLLTPQMAERCRRIDKVKVKGSAQPMPLYCFDIYPGLIDELRPRVEPRLSERVAAHVLKNGEAIKKPHAPERVYSQTLYALDRKQTAASATASTAAAATSPRGASGKPLSRVASLGGGASGGGAALYQVTINGQTIRSIDWSLDPQLAVIQAGLDPAFARMCALGVEQYLDGDWPAATETLQAVIDRFGHDGPTSVLLSYMRNRECTAPADWDGCRALTSK